MRAINSADFGESDPDVFLPIANVGGAIAKKSDCIKQRDALEQVGSILKKLCKWMLEKGIQMSDPVELLLSISYDAKFGDVLTIEVLNARGLPGRTEKIAPSGSYVKLWLVQRNNRIERRRTSVRPQSVMPIFNESFTFGPFDAAEDALKRECNLVFTLMNHFPRSNDHEIGHVVVGNLGSELGMRHWREIFEQPDTAVLQWHKLKRNW